MEVNTLKINEFAKNILLFLRTHPRATPDEILREGLGKTPEEVAFVVTQLRMFGYL
jgi:hypothetical protein